MTLDSVDLSELANTSNALVVLSPEEYSHQQTHVKKLDEIHDSNGKTVFVVTEL